MNKNFACLNSVNTIIYAPEYLIIGKKYVWHPTYQQYIDAGWFELIDEQPTPEEGYYFVRTEKGEMKNGKIYYVYEKREVPPAPPPEPRVFSKLSLTIELAKIQKYQTLLAWLESIEVYPNSGLYLITLWNTAVNISEGFENFDVYKEQARIALNLSNEELETILNNSIFVQ